MAFCDDGEDDWGHHVTLDGEEDLHLSVYGEYDSDEGEMYIRVQRRNPVRARGKEKTKKHRAEQQEQPKQQEKIEQPKQQEREETSILVHPIAHAIAPSETHQFQWQEYSNVYDVYENMPMDLENQCHQTEGDTYVIGISEDGTKPNLPLKAMEPMSVGYFILSNAIVATIYFVSVIVVML